MRHSVSLACVTVLSAACFGGCENIQRSLVFSTGTTIGVEVAVKPQSDTPVQLMIGYKRAEVLFDPIMEDKRTCLEAGTPRTYTIKDQSHSVIAKLLGEIRGSGGTGATPQVQGTVKVGQWFASGKAAEILARHPQLAVTLTEDPQVARAVASVPFQQLHSINPELAMSVITNVYNRLLPESGETFSHELRVEVDNMLAALDRSDIVRATPAMRCLPYKFSNGTIGWDDARAAPLPGFGRVLDYIACLNISIERLTRAKRDNTSQLTDSTGTIPTTPSGALDLQAKIDELERVRNDFRERLFSDAAVQEFLQFIVGR